MSRKHFRAIAAALRDVRPIGDAGAYYAWRQTVRAIARALAASNPRFSFDRFERAAGFDDTEELAA